MARAATRITLRHDDIPAQRAWVEAVRAETYTGMPRRLPRVIRPKPPELEPQPLLFGVLPLQLRPPKPTDLASMPELVPEASPGFPPLTPEDVQALEIYAKGIAPGYPEAYGSMWNAFVLKGAVFVPIDVLVSRTAKAGLRLTRTRLGWTAGFELTVRERWSGDGGFQHPNVDEIGWFMWDSRQAAEQAAAHAILGACADSGVAQRIRDSLARLGIDGSEEPGEPAKLRLISRAHAAAITAAGPSERELAIQDPGPSEDVRAYERALGLTDVDGPPPEPPKKARASKPSEISIAKARPAEPAPDIFSAEELAEIEAFVADGQKHGRVGDAARKRWDAWIMDGRTVERKILQLPGVNARADVEVLETRLGWAANVCYATSKKSARHPWLLHRPEIDPDCRFFWRTRDAAIAYSANMAYRVGLEYQGHERERRSWARFADEMKGFLARCGIDVAIAPPASMRRVLVTDARVRALKAGAPPTLAPAPAATTPPPAPVPAAPKPEAAEDQAKPPRIETDRNRTLTQVVAAAGMLSMREPTLPDRMEIHAAIGEALPPGVPTYVREIVAVNRAPGQKGGRIIADVEMFDGEMAQIEFDGPPGGRRYRWHSIGPEGSACYWDGQEGRWKRVPEQA